MPDEKAIQEVNLDEMGVRATTSTVSESVNEPADVEFRPGQQRLLRFRNALHTAEPKRPVSLTPMRRSRSGNRTNDIMAGRDSAEGDRKKPLVRKRTALKECQAEETSPFVLYVMVVATTLGLLLTVGLAGERRELLEPRPSVAGDHAVSGGRAGVRNAGTPVIFAPVVRHDDKGEPVEIRASDPRSVLYGFCSAREGTMCEPVELAWTEPRHPAVRIGIFRDFFGLRAVRIHRDPVSGQWVSGDGRNPVRDSLVSGLRLSAARIPV
jgi:hypothetical protein